MPIRIALRAALAKAVDEYGNYDGSAVDATQVLAARMAIAAYLKAWPQGCYAASAQGLVRHGEDRRIRQLHSPDAWLSDPVSHSPGSRRSLGRPASLGAGAEFQRLCRVPAARRCETFCRQSQDRGFEPPHWLAAMNRCRARSRRPARPAGPAGRRKQPEDASFLPFWPVMHVEATSNVRSIRLDKSLATPRRRRRVSPSVSIPPFRARPRRRQSS